MGTPTWKRLVPDSLIKVPEQAGIAWTPVIDYLTPGRLYMIRVSYIDPKEPQTWTPDGGTACTADGDPGLTRASTPLVAGAPIGALIARVGGSTADAAGDAERSLLFAAGRYCVFQAPEPPKAGALFLGVNDVPAIAVKLSGNLLVEVCEAR